MGVGVYFAGALADFGLLLVTVLVFAGFFVPARFFMARNLQ